MYKHSFPTSFYLFGSLVIEFLVVFVLDLLLEGIFVGDILIGNWYYYTHVDDNISNKLIYFFTNLSILLNRFDNPPPPTTCPHSVCVGSRLIVESVLLEAADAHHGGDSCVFGSF